MTIDPTVGAAVGDGRLEFGRDGKLTKDHPYLSAIALLRRREHQADRIAEVAAEERGDRDPSDFDEATSEALKLLERLDREDLPEGDYLYVDLIETTSALHRIIAALEGREPFAGPGCADRPGASCTRCPSSLLIVVPWSARMTGHLSAGKLSWPTDDEQGIAMQKWEYLVAPLKDATGLKKSSEGLTPDSLNKLGADGWEAVGVSLKQGDLIAWPVVLLKRPLT